MELRHSGWAAGFDFIIGHRYHWQDHDFNGSFKFAETQTYDFFSGYFTVATGFPFYDEKHRFILALHGGLSPTKGLDRYSGVRLGGGPTGDESEAISRSVIPGVRFDEYVVDRYIIATFEYRWEIFFFLYFHIKATIGGIRRLTFDDVEEKLAFNQNDFVSSIGVAITTGFIWDSQLYIEYVQDRGVAGRENNEGNNFLFSWSKSF